MGGVSEYRYVAEMAAAAERRRIRRLIAPHLEALHGPASDWMPSETWLKAVSHLQAIDRATKAPPKKRAA